MIVKITEQNQAIYDSFFASITDAFAETNKTVIINSLSSYYSNIQDIATLKNGKFLRLPIWDEASSTGEEFFAINADTRKITIPSNFTKNGIAVQDDNLAEIVYFTVDRYYDRTDLKNMTIEIRWSLSGTGYNKSDSVKAVFIDDETLVEEGKLIFGWPITKDMCAVKGTLSFAVCFYSDEVGNQRLYSLNTLPATINVNAGLKMDNPSCTDYSNTIINLLTDSAYSDASIAALSTPVWEYLTWETNDNPSSTRSGDNATYGLIDYNEQSYEFVNLDDDTGTLDLKARAYIAVSDAKMDYNWYGTPIFAKDESDTENTSDLNKMVASFPEIGTPYDTATLSYELVNYEDGYKDNEKYFKVDNDSTMAVLKNSDASAIFDEYKETTDKTSFTTQIYTQKSYLSISEPGIYTVKARALQDQMVTNEAGATVTMTAKSAVIKSNSCIVPKATSLTISDGIKVANNTIESSTLTFADESKKDDYCYLSDDAADIYVEVPTITTNTTVEHNYHGKVALVLSNNENYDTILEAFGYNKSTNTFNSPVLYQVPEAISGLTYVDSYADAYVEVNNHDDTSIKYYVKATDDKYADKEFDGSAYREATDAELETETLYVKNGKDYDTLIDLGLPNVEIKTIVDDSEKQYIKLYGVLIHKLNKTYAISNVIESKIISKNASKPVLEEEDGTMNVVIIKTIDNANTTIALGSVGENKYYSVQIGTDDTVKITADYNSSNLKNVGTINVVWHDSAKNLVVSDSDITVSDDGASITIKGSLNANGFKFYPTFVNTFNNVQESTELEYPIVIGEVDL